MTSAVYTTYLPPNPEEVALNKGDIFIQLGKDSSPQVWTGKKWAELQIKASSEEPEIRKNRIADILWGLVALIALVAALALAVTTIHHEKTTESLPQNLDSVIQIV